MKYTVVMETYQLIDVEAENEAAAIEAVKKQIDPRVAAAANFSIAIEPVLEEVTPPPAEN